MLTDGAVRRVRELGVPNAERLDVRALPEPRSLGARVAPRDPRVQQQLHEKRDGRGGAVEDEGVSVHVRGERGDPVRRRRARAMARAAD
jgi:hypothetical protein